MNANDAATSDTPGVPIPPPLFYLPALLVGTTIGRRFAWRLLPDDGIAGGMGKALMLLAVTLAALGLREFRSARTSFRVDRSASGLITTGPFRFTRNPLYLALSLLYAGNAFRRNNAWLLALLPPTLLALTRQVIEREERYLDARFGNTYREYQMRVRRWL